MSFIYLASPYTHPDPGVMELRFLQTERFVAEHLADGTHIFSPIVHCHSLARKYALPKKYEFWKAYNETMLAKAGFLWVLCLPGWVNSRGVKEETKFALSLSISVINVYPTLFSWCPDE